MQLFLEYIDTHHGLRTPNEGRAVKAISSCFTFEKVKSKERYVLSSL